MTAQWEQHVGIRSTLVATRPRHTVETRLPEGTTRQERGTILERVSPQSWGSEGAQQSAPLVFASRLPARCPAACLEMSTPTLSHATPPPILVYRTRGCPSIVLSPSHFPFPSLLPPFAVPAGHARHRSWWCTRVRRKTILWLPCNSGYQGLWSSRVPSYFLLLQRFFLFWCDHFFFPLHKGWISWVTGISNCPR